MPKKRDRNPVNEAQKYNKVTLTAKTPVQKEYIKAIKNTDQVFAIGPAGTGKTYIATVLATQMYLIRQVSKIIITRPTVGADNEQIGFLPGDMKQKMAPWVVPIVEVIQNIVGKAMMEEMLRNGDLEIAPFAFMRGRTFNDAFVILDEAQNCSIPQIELFLTRIGEGAKVVVSGDVNQTDLGKKSGLTVAVKLIRENNIPAELIEFKSEDVVRSHLCKAWVEAFTGYYQLT